MMATVPGLLSKRLVIVTGKGGVGKSTVSLALALAASRQGKRTILCEVSAQEHLSHVFHRSQVGFREVEMRENLWAISIDPDESMREYVLLQLKVKAMRDLLFRSRLFTYLAAATPGLKELVTIGKIWELALDDRKSRDGRRYDLVIVDAPATGHGVGFLQTPRTFANVARVGPIRQQAETLDAFIRDPKRTGVAVVALPEEMPVNETVALERDLGTEVGVGVDRIFCNALYPQRFTEPETERITEATSRSSALGRAAGRAALTESRRARAQREQLARLEENCEAPVSTLPFLFEPELGVDQVVALADRVAL
jgi:anion-transporting  ArsA/GET3 family ATPase